MPHWFPQTYQSEAVKQGADGSTISCALETARKLVKRTTGAPPIFTLKHLSLLAQVDYRFMRELIASDRNKAYKVFRIHKRSPDQSGRKRYRTICVPDARLMRLQKWINQLVLSVLRPHDASVAFSEGDQIVKAAQRHCGCRWLIKIDILSFFESVDEAKVYWVFRQAGYQPLIAFELARICTRVGGTSRFRNNQRWRNFVVPLPTISAYHQPSLGYLPQGAPTSPRLANLVMRFFDEEVSKLAKQYGLIYTRYADDLAFSTDSADFSRDKAQVLIHKVYQLLGRHGFRPNVAKTSIATPGARRVVLGLLVDGDKPALTKEFRKNMRLHLHYICQPDHGAAKHAEARSFVTIYGMRNYLLGLIAYAGQVDPVLAEEWKKKMLAAKWPLIEHT